MRLLTINLFIYFFLFSTIANAQKRDKVDFWYEEVGDFIKVFGKNDTKEDTIGHLFFPLDPNGKKDQYTEVFLPRKTDKRLLKTFNISSNPSGQVENFYYKFWVNEEDTYIELQESYYYDKLRPSFKDKSISKSDLVNFIIEGFELYKDEDVKKAFKLLKKKYPKIDSNYTYLIDNIGTDTEIISVKFFKNNLDQLLAFSSDKQELIATFVDRVLLEQSYRDRIKPDKIKKYLDEETEVPYDSTLTAVALQYELNKKWTKSFSENYIHNYRYNELNHEGIFTSFRSCIINYHKDELTQSIFDYIENIDLTTLQPKLAIDLLSLRIYALHNLGEKERAAKINRSTSLFAKSKGVPFEPSVYELLVEKGFLKD